LKKLKDSKGEGKLGSELLLKKPFYRPQKPE